MNNRQEKLMENPGGYKLPWGGLISVSLIVSILYPFLEWLFISTMPSFMSASSFIDKLIPLLFSASLFSLISIILIGVARLICYLPPGNKLDNLIIRFACLEPAVLLAMICLLMLDNFTYTMFKFGIVSTTGLIRGFYGLAFLGGTWLLYLFIIKRVGELSKISLPVPLKRTLIAAAAVMMIASLSGPLIKANSSRISMENVSAGVMKTRPNILYITSDGMLASHFSVYGYERETTPNLDKLAESAVVVENDFSNAGSTSGSLVSILTGKYPTETLVLYPPNILRGEDADQHLPGILRSYGYYSVMISHPYFADPYILNLKEGFNEANGRPEYISPLLAKFNRIVPTNEAYFLYEMGNRISDRLRHILFLKQMTNPYDLVTEPPTYMQDQSMFDKLMNLLSETKQPLYVQMHMLGTHGPTFKPRKQVFSEGQNPDTQEKFTTDFFDDSIYDLDSYLGTLIEKLKESKQLDNTIIIIGSDHSQRTNGDITKIMTTFRIPLIIRFPNGDHAGRITTNIQNMDVSPTLLDYLDLEKPTWMKGESILRPLPQNRPIFAVKESGTDKENGKLALNPAKVLPPFFQFGSISVVECDLWYLYNLKENKWLSGNVSGSTTTCQESERISAEQAFELMVNHLKENGFDVSSLKGITPYKTQ